MSQLVSQLQSQTVLVLGLGESGLSMLRWLHGQGARLRVADSRVNPPGLDQVSAYVAADQVFCGPLAEACFTDIDLIAISPGVPLATPAVQAAIQRGVPVVGDIELFARYVPAQQVVAITGANGKTTVTSLVAHLCQQAGKDAVAAGNISPAVLDVVCDRGAQQPAIWVLELSSFQLETTSSLQLSAATVLNVTEDHLDRYDNSMTQYAAAKQRIFAHAAVQVLNRDDVYSWAMLDPNKSLVSFGLNEPKDEGDYGIRQHQGECWLALGSQNLMPASALQLTGLHNVANALAALALCRALDLPMDVLLQGLRSFKGLPHRVEWVGRVAEVDYYDDSKGTNVGATLAALQGLARPVVLIAGGDGKGQDFSPLLVAVQQHARAVVLIGRDAARIEQALQSANVPLIHAPDLPTAVKLAAQQAQAGDVVLLSPACASLDMFRNYVHRAEVFIEAVRELEAAWLR